MSCIFDKYIIQKSIFNPKIHILNQRIPFEKKYKTNWVIIFFSQLGHTPTRHPCAVHYKKKESMFCIDSFFFSRVWILTHRHPHGQRKNRLLFGEEPLIYLKRITSLPPLLMCPQEGSSKVGSQKMWLTMLFPKVLPKMISPKRCPQKLVSKMDPRKAVPTYRFGFSYMNIINWYCSIWCDSGEESLAYLKATTLSPPVLKVPQNDAEKRRDA